LPAVSTLLREKNRQRRAAGAPAVSSTTVSAASAAAASQRARIAVVTQHHAGVPIGVRSHGWGSHLATLRKRVSAAALLRLLQPC
jgi:hypothetical protein